MCPDDSSVHHIDSAYTFAPCAITKFSISSSKRNFLTKFNRCNSVEINAQLIYL